MSVKQFFDPELLKKYNTSGPRYTSYPTALEFHHNFSNDELAQALRQSSTDNLSLYVHIPFCHSLCYYCGCNKIVTRHSDKADEYLGYLSKEMSARAEQCEKYKVRQLHLGGGTPSFLSNLQMVRLIGLLHKYFDIAEDIEMSIEIDPRRIELDYLNDLRALGFNRVSFGVQDINSKVQKAINREQSTEFISQLVARAKALEFDSINLDLIYGLPHQSPSTMAQTLTAVKAMDVHRISLFSYAHLPSRFAAQRKLKGEWLPNATQKLALMQQATETLTQHGYELIGMDHFAKPNDELAMAQQQGVLHRNFQGYTTKGECDMLGLGVSAISAVGHCYGQNHKELKDYYHSLNQHQHGIDKGLLLSKDDLLRRDVIREIMCNLHVDKTAINAQHNINFDQYFAEDIKALQTFIDDKLLSNNSTQIQVAAKARLLVRLICMCFDTHMKKQLNQQRFSRVI